MKLNSSPHVNPCMALLLALSLPASSQVVSLVPTNYTHLAQSQNNLGKVGTTWMPESEDGLSLRGIVLVTDHLTYFNSSFAGSKRGAPSRIIDVRTFHWSGGIQYRLVSEQRVVCFGSKFGINATNELTIDDTVLYVWSPTFVGSRIQGDNRRRIEETGSAVSLNARNIANSAQVVRVPCFTAGGPFKIPFSLAANLSTNLVMDMVRANDNVEHTILAPNNLTWFSTDLDAATEEPR